MNLTETDVREILRLLDRNISQGALAKEYNVSRKTISRINTGETWSNVSKRVFTKEPVTHDIPIPDRNETLFNLLDEVVSVKNIFGLDFSKPINWGKFDWYDGCHNIATDGYIMWESLDLMTFAEKLSESDVGLGSHELPTFGLKALMTLPLGPRYIIDADAGGVVKLLSDDNTIIYLRKKYIEIATRLRFEFRKAGDRTDLAYMVHSKKRETIMAAVAALEATHV